MTAVFPEKSYVMDISVPPALNGVVSSASFSWIVACAVVGFFFEANSSDQRQ